jgi:hypothetical protein
LLFLITSPFRVLHIHARAHVHGRRARLERAASVSEWELPFGNRSLTVAAPSE